MTTFGPKPKKFYLFSFLYWIAVFTALFLWSRDWKVVQATVAGLEHLFGLFGFCVFCVLFCFAYHDFSTRSESSLRNWILIGLPFLVSLFFLSLVIEMSQKSWDYNNYENAFRSVAVGDNPYLSMHSLYPPPFATTMVSVYKLGRWLIPVLGMELKESQLWNFVFYIHQSAMLFFLICAYYLSLEFSRKIGVRKLKGVLFISGLFIFNVPILRTISYNQINFYILVSILVSMLLLSSYPYISGFAIAVGGLIKLYPFAFIAPLLGTKKWKALLGIVVGVIAIILIQTKFLQDLLLWKQFVLFYISFPVERESSWFRSTSPLSLTRNLLDFIGLPTTFVVPIFGVLLLAILVWFTIRFLQRERIYSLATKQQVNIFVERDIFRDVGHLVDFSALLLLVEPSAWEHHYIIAIPLAIWVFATHHKDSSGLAAIGMVLVFLLPVYNVFPFSYLRLLGLVILLVLCSPKRIVSLGREDLIQV